MNSLKSTLILVVLIALMGCAPKPDSVAEVSSTPAEIAATLTPTLAATDEPTLAATDAPPTAIPTAAPTFTQIPGCTYGAEFVSDVNYPDGTHIKPGEVFTKVWRFKNSGTCNWDASLELSFAFGTIMTTETKFSVPQAAPGETVELSVQMTAPVATGENVSVWGLVNKTTGAAVGAQPYLRIIVSEDAVSSALPVSGSAVSATSPEGCTDNAEFVADITVADNAVFDAGETFTKTWRMRNSGTCTWGSGYKLVFLDGTLLAANNSYDIPATPPGGTADISVEMTAPTGSGNYVSIWQITAPYGQRFGMEPYLRIVVGQNQQAATSTSPYPWLTGVTFHSRQIYLQGQSYGNRPNVFSKVGDSISFAWHFMWALGEGKANLGSYSDLGPALNYFSTQPLRMGNSFNNPSIASYPGWRAVDLLDPSKAEAGCNGRSPLVCEYETSRPASAIIMIGTNDCTAHTDLAQFEANLRTITQTSINYGVIPVLSTIPHIVGYCNAQDYNTVILTTARSFDVPLIDLYAAMDPLPNHGIDSDGVHPTVPPDNNPANFTGSNLDFGYTMRTLTALQTLDVLWRQVMSY